jgi:hypothetical protein
MDSAEKTIDYWVGARNEVQFEAEAVSESMAKTCWERLGVINRHITRVVSGLIPLTPGLEKEMQDCLDHTRQWLRH